MSPAVHKETRSVDQAPAAGCKLGTGSEGAASRAHRPDKLTDPGPAAEAEAETGFATQGAGEMEEETLFVDEMPTAADGSGRRRAEEGELDDRANADGSAIGDETRSDAQIFEDAASYQISDDDSSVDSIQAEKQEDGRMQYFIHATVRVKMSPRGSRRRI
ncbi:hypothetical protein BDD12DRAFT_804699 [Trichophaea hybrida]|nr:hypothetical protein BDD12DRAFT_804699 [Trichophaea hybrida]